jgi:hypothetical protein
MLHPWAKVAAHWHAHDYTQALRILAIAAWVFEIAVLTTWGLHGDHASAVAMGSYWLKDAAIRRLERGHTPR